MAAKSQEVPLGPADPTQAELGGKKSSFSREAGHRVAALSLSGFAFMGRNAVLPVTDPMVRSYFQTATTTAPVTISAPPTSTAGDGFWWKNT